MYKIIDYYNGKTYELDGVKFEGYETEEQAKQAMIDLKRYAIEKEIKVFNWLMLVEKM